MSNPGYDLILRPVTPTDETRPKFAEERFGKQIIGGKTSRVRSAFRFGTEMTGRFVFFVVAAGLLSTTGLQAQGDLEAVNVVNTGNVFSQYVIGPLDNGTMGWTFSASQDITIDNLGWMFGGTNPPSVPIVSVGLWSVDGTLLRSTVIDNNSVSINGNLYEAISPLFVSAGTMLVVAAGSSGHTFNIIAPPTSVLQPLINSAGDNYSYGNGFTFPVGNSADGLVPAATFLFQPIPEPGTSRLFACGAVLLVFCGWKRRGAAKPQPRERGCVEDQPQRPRTAGIAFLLP